MPNRHRAPAAALVVLAIAVLLLATIAGCGDDEGAGETTTTSTTTPADGSTAAGATGDGSTEAGTDDGPSQGPTDEEQIESAIETFLVSPDSETVCNALVTENLLRTAYGDRQGCLDGRGRPTLATSAQIDFDVSGSEAQATAVPKGGVYAGSDVGFTLVEDGGTWRIDSVEADIPVGP